MDFLLNEEQKKFRQEVREFAETKLMPNSFDWDEKGHFPLDEIKEMAGKGWLGIPWPKDVGGKGMDFLSYAIALEEISRADPGVGVFLSVHSSAATSPLYDWGSDELKEKYLPLLASGEKLGAFALTENDAGSDAGGTETTAVLDGDEYVINGEKIYITNAPFADIYTVFAVTTPGKGTRGISAFIVEKDTPGFEFKTIYNKMGLKSSSTAQLVFNNVRVPKENMVGPEGKGFNIAMTTLNGGRIGIASQSLGIAQRALEEAIEHAKNRYQFGAPIGANQAVANKIADMATRVRAARLMTYTAAMMKDAGEDFLQAAAMAKLFSSETAAFVVDEALQIHGGSGYIKGLPIERLYRDARVTRIYEGTSEVQKIVISGSILGKLGKKSAPSKDKKKEVRKVTGDRKVQIFDQGTVEERVDKLIDAVGLENLKGDSVDINGPIAGANKIVAFGRGVTEVGDMKLFEDLANATGSVLSASRPIAEENEWLPLNRYVGLSGQKFAGDLYIGAGISGQVQHLYGIKDAKTIITINNDPKAPFFQQADYGIVGDYKEVVKVLLEKLS
ncbi:MAG: acyl-CoA dehydrogenase family protein [Anaerococcus sp.]|jgi:alkylation response protein AidB-like acyl-CoA dehydrogenase|nr:acyl-CoA dehydrogenase family protein [Peptoniphilaceae bacterium]MDY3055994.1 acyl-CoA dehydrogenase family protein [Anaerococcus sp.]